MDVFHLYGVVFDPLEVGDAARREESAALKPSCLDRCLLGWIQGEDGSGAQGRCVGSSSSNVTKHVNCWQPLQTALFFDFRMRFREFSGLFWVSVRLRWPPKVAYGGVAGAPFAGFVPDFDGPLGRACCRVAILSVWRPTWSFFAYCLWDAGGVSSHTQFGRSMAPQFDLCTRKLLCKKLAVAVAVAVWVHGSR